MFITITIVYKHMRLLHTTVRNLRNVLSKFTPTDKNIGNKHGQICMSYICIRISRFHKYTHTGSENTEPVKTFSTLTHIVLLMIFYITINCKGIIDKTETEKKFLLSYIMMQQHPSTCRVIQDL